MMMMTHILKSYALLLLVVLNVYSLQAQDAHYSNYQHNTLQLSPAFTGLISNEANQRVAFNYRDQWRSFLENGAYQTTSVAYDRRGCIPKRQDDFWGIGGSLTGDQAGHFALNRIDLLVTGSFIKHLFDVSTQSQAYLVFGVEAGLIHHRLGQNDWLFDEQFDNPASPGETFDHLSFSQLDVGTGLLFYLTGEDKTSFGFTLGGAIKHLREPYYQFYDNPDNALNDARLRKRFIGHGKLMIPIIEGSSGLSLKSVFMSQDPYVQFVAGVDFMLEGRRSDWTVGAAWRQVKRVEGSHADALVLSTTFNFKQFAIGFSYDANISSLQKVSNRIGGYELSLGYVFGRGECELVYCP